MDANEDSVVEYMQNSRIMRLQLINQAIVSGDKQALEILLNRQEDDLLMEVIDLAIGSGNAKSVCAVMGIYSKQIFRYDINRMEFFEQTLSLEVDPDKKMDIIEAILYYTFPEDPNRAYMYPIMDIFYLIVSCCLRQKKLLKKFFNIYYTKEFNSLYPLMKRLEKAVDGSRYISVLLHDEIDLMRIMVNVQHTTSIMKLKFYIARHLKHIFEAFVKLLQKNTKETMELAVEAFKELLKKNLIAYVVFILNTNDFGSLTVTMNNPLIKKLCFQFVYYLQDDVWQDEVYKIITFWLDVYNCPSDSKTYQKIYEFLRPYVQKPSPLKKSLEKQDTENEAYKVQSLTEICRDAIRSIVTENVKDMKTFMDGIWAFNVPQTVKCNLLYIPDPSWMNDLIKF